MKIIQHRRIARLTAGAFVGAAFLMAMTDTRAAAPAASALVPGITEPFHDAWLSAPSAGTVGKIFFKEGDAIAEGAVILELDKAMEELEVARRRSIFESRAELEAAEQRAATLRNDFESTKRLFDKSQSVSRDELEKKELDFKLASAERDRLIAAKERERIEFDMAREQLVRRQVISPFAGVVTEMKTDLGEACEPRQQVVRVVDLSRAYFVANVAPSLTRSLAAGREVKLRIETPSGEKEMRGKIDYLAPVVDPGSGLRRVKVVFDNPAGAIAPGALGNLVLE